MTAKKFTLKLVSALPIFFLLLCLQSVTGRPVNKSSKNEKLDVCDSPDCVMAAGEMLSYINKSALPCQNFYEYACGNYPIEENIAAGNMMMSPFHKGHLLIQKRFKTVLESNTGRLSDSVDTAKSKILRYYRSCLNLTKIEENGVEKLRGIVASLGGLMLNTLNKLKLSSWSIENALENYNFFKLDAFFNIGIGADDKDSKTHIIQIDQGQLFLADSRSLYINASVTEDPIMIAFADLLQAWAEIILGEDAALKREHIVDVIEFEKHLAEIHEADEDRINVKQIYEKVNISWLNEHALFINWTIYLNSLFRNTGSGIVVNNSEPVVIYAGVFLKKLAYLIEEYSASEQGKRILQNYLVFRVISDYGPGFGSQLEDSFLRFQTKFIGISGRQDRWQRCLEDFSSFIGYPLSAMYIEKHLPPSAKPTITNAVDQVMEAVRGRMNRSTWMNETDKAIAVAKLNKMTFDIAYPDWLFNTSYVDELFANFTVSDDYTENSISAFSFIVWRSFKKLRVPIDDSFWLMIPHAVNAYYTPNQNKFVIPAGLLTSPFFIDSAQAPKALIFGAIGSITAHEILHSVDNQGRQFDKYGNLDDWWQNETIAAFKKQTECLIDQYDDYEILGMKVNGLLTLGENIADNGGVQSAYQAYAAAAPPKSDPSLVGVEATSEQLYYIAYAQVWCAIQPATALKLRLLTDPHAPNEARVNLPLANSAHFADSFQCPIGSPMNPAKKCSVW